MKVFHKLLTGIGDYLNRPKSRMLYAVTGGKYLGEFFIYMETVDDKHMFLSLPHMELREVPIIKFNFAVNNKILDPVESVPRDVYKLCKAQYKTTTNAINN